MVTRTTIGLTGLAVGILMLGALLLTQPWRASGAPPEPDWRCARLAEAAVTLRQQAEQAPVPAGIVPK